ncbi:ribonuclease domain-containing protein [Nocardia sp. NBC_01327]|uniref:ribonuclease domain-containing protein n=1 Tax=Nocardia sp. NBC_01327 TaxID=2903593 RepID=UPI002E137213|nr:ribonuclease [Nocardia sp. NBC_01327]
MKISSRTRAWLLLGGALIMVLVAVLVSRGGDHAATTSSAKVTTTVAGKTTTAAKPGPRATAPGAVDEPTHAAGVPDRAYQTLIEIDAGRWPGSANSPGTHGGDTWMNRGGSLPAQDSSGKKISYQEWDVNPKKPGQGRDAQRIITGSDGSAYYTGDHYNTFTKMR